MLNWNKISQWKSKAGDISSKMKGFAKDLITVDVEQDDDVDFSSQFEKLAKASSQSPQSTPTPVKVGSDLKIELPAIKKPIDEIRTSYCTSINSITNKIIQKHNEQINEIEGIEKEKYLMDAEEFENEIKDVVVEAISRIEEAMNQNDQTLEICGSLNQFFIQLGRNTQFSQKVAQQNDKRELIKLIEKSLNNTVNEIRETKDQLQNQLQKQQQEKMELQKKLVDSQDKISGQNLLFKEVQSKMKEQEKYMSEWDKIKRDYIEEIKQNYCEIENLQQKLKMKEQEVSVSQSEMNKIYELKNQIEQKDEEIDRLEHLLEEWQQENQQLQTGIQSIQVLYDQEKEKREQMMKKYEQEMKKMRNEVRKEDLTQLKVLKEQNEKLKKSNGELSYKLEEQQLMIDNLQIKIKEIQGECVALQNKIRQDQSYANNVIDKRVIANCLITFFDFNTDFSVKQQVLETISSLLNLSKEEKEKIMFSKGISQQQQQQQQQHQQQQNKDSLKEKFIGFLMNSE